MNGIHEMAGRFGYGPIYPEPDEPVFHADWERTALTMFPAMALAGAFNLDAFRHGMERIQPADYITSTYYEHWLHSMEEHGINAGIFDADELERRTAHYLENPDADLPPSQETDLKSTLETIIPGGLSCYRPSDKPAKFQVGDRVRVAVAAPKTHTRRAGYVQDREGEIVFAHGTYVYPDTNARGEGENPEHVYTIKFAARTLWGDEDVDPTVSVYFDAFEPYLEPA